MEPHQIFAALERQLLWVVAAIVASVLVALSTAWDVTASGIEKRTRTAAVARAEFLVDSERSALVDLAKETAPLTARAEIYAQYMRSNVVRLTIAKRVGLAPGLLAVGSPTTAAEGTQNIPRPGPARATEVREEERRYRIAFAAQPQLPVVTITAQAPTSAEAIELVHAAVATFARRIEAVALANKARPAASSTRTIAKVEHARVVPLGSTVVGTINGRADLAVAVLAFLVALATGCLAIVGGDALASRRGGSAVFVDRGTVLAGDTYDRLGRVLADLRALHLRSSSSVLDPPRQPPESVGRGRKSSTPNG